jgi:4-hydroxy-tetrahydrodipicolinate synthase
MGDRSRFVASLWVIAIARATASPAPWHHAPTMKTPPTASDAVLRGTWYVVPTAFDATGALDTDSLARLVDAAIGWGVDGLTAMGVMAEPGSLSADERGAALRTVMDATAGRVPVAVGCSGPTVSAVLALGHEARDLGATAAMVAAPTLLRDIDLLPGFYRAVGQGIGLPLILQDEPAATGVVVPVSMILACLSASGSRTVKLEDPPTPPKIGRLLVADPALAVFGGLGGAAALWELERGACGTMTGFAYPEILRAVRLAIESGDRDRAGRLFDRYLPLIAFEAQPVVGLAIRKELLRRRGALRHAGTRGLGGPLDDATLGALDVTLDRVGIVPAIEPLLPTLRL